MTEEFAANWVKDSERFDAVADAYERHRPTYPQDLIDHVISLTHLPPTGKILEIGCGTGQATRLFAQRGHSIHCIEPGKNLAQAAAEQLRNFPGVSFERVRFEEWQEQEVAFDLVISAQAFHWVSPAIGYPKIARTLKPEGFLALFWNMYPGLTNAIADELQWVYQERAPELANRREEIIEEVIQQRAKSIAESGCFGPVSIQQFPWSVRYATQDYLGLLNTYSDHLRLSEQTRHHLLDGVAEVINRNGGIFERPYLSVLYTAPKKV